MGKLPANRATKAYNTEMKRIINNAPSKAHTGDRALQRDNPEKGDLTQAEKFAKAAREHGADQDEEAFKGVLRKLGKAKR